MKNDWKGMEHLPNLEHLRMAALASTGLMAEFARAAAQDIEELLELLPVRREATLPASAWAGSAAPYTQTVSVEGVRADEAGQLVQIVPRTAGREAWDAAGVRCTAQGAGKLTFSAQEKPSGNISVFVLLQAFGGEAASTLSRSEAGAREVTG